MRHNCNRKARGSAIILVAAVLAALVLIGSAFLMTAVSQKKVALAQRQAVPMENVVDGVMGQISERLWADLAIGAGGPYSADSNWQAYVDYPSPDPKYADPNDRDYDNYLASPELALADGLDNGAGKLVNQGRWPKLTNLWGDPNSAKWCRNQDPNWDYDSNSPTANVLDTDGDNLGDAPLRLVDTDGDRLNDAMLLPTGVYNEAGEQFFAAVRIIDLSGLVNVNTGFHALWDPNLAAGQGASQVPMGDGPLGVGLVGPGTMYAQSVMPNEPAAALAFSYNAANGTNPYRFHQGRYKDPNAATSIWLNPTYGGDVAIRLPNPRNLPADLYRPYDWSDELSCRWRDYVNMVNGLPNPSALMQNSRLARTVITGNANDFRDWAHWSRNITTWSASRILPRPGDNAGGVGWERPTAKVDLNLPLNTTPFKQAAYDTYRRAFFAMLPHIATVDARKIMAAQLAVNLIDFRDADDDPTCVAVQGIAVARNVMGVERQPVAVQVWHKLVQYDDNDPNTPETGLQDKKVYVAIGFMNPYSDALTIKYIEYFYRVGVAPEQQFPAPLGTITLQPGERWVVKNNVNVQHAPGVQFKNLNTPIQWSDDVVICRRVPLLDTGQPVFVPIAKAPGLYYKPTLGGGGGTYNVFCSFNLRDDDPNNYRMFVAKYFTREMVYDSATEDTTATTDYLYDCDVTTDTLPPTTPSGKNYVGRPNNLFPTSLTAADIKDGNTPDGALEWLPPTPVYIRGIANVAERRLISVGELSRIFCVGPEVDAVGAGKPLDVVINDKLKKPVSAANYVTNLGVGRLDSLAFRDAAVAANPAYPDVSMLALAGDYFTVNSPLKDLVDNDGDGYFDYLHPSDMTPQMLPTDANYQNQLARWNRDTVVYGKINVNTATLAALTALPTLGPNANSRAQIAAEIIAYRDRLAGNIFIPNSAGAAMYNDDFSLSRQPRMTEIGIPVALAGQLRNDTGFAATGEVAIPLRRMINLPADANTKLLLDRFAAPGSTTLSDYLPNGLTYCIGPQTNTAGEPTDDDLGMMGNRPMPQNDLAKWDLRYAYVSNLVTVNSDVFCAFIRVQLGDDKFPKSKRNYVAVFDRSNCVTATDRPIVRMFAEIK